jgi:hypothetical protein
MYFVTKLANLPSLVLFTPDIRLRRAATATTAAGMAASSPVGAAKTPAAADVVPVRAATRFAASTYPARRTYRQRCMVADALSTSLLAPGHRTGRSHRPGCVANPVSKLKQTEE